MSFAASRKSARVAFVNDLLRGAAPLSLVVSWPLKCGFTPARSLAWAGVFFGSSSGAHHAIVRRIAAAINGPIASISIVGLL